MSKWQTYQSAQFAGIVYGNPQQASNILVLLHGVGGNEQSMLSIAEYLANNSLVICLRAPLQFSQNAYGWFQVQFTATGPVHNWPQALQSVHLLEKELQVISQRYSVNLSNIAIGGFSQGAIMTMGLALQSALQLSHYLCFSGRTLPEFATFAQQHPQYAANRHIFLAHGTQDSKLPVHFARTTQQLLHTLNSQLRYHEFTGDHEIVLPVLTEAKTWLAL